VQGLATESLKLEFDPKIVEFRDATEGEALTAEPGKAAVTIVSQTTEGVVELQLHGIGHAAKQEGRLLQLTFVAKTTGVSPIHVQGVRQPVSDKGGQEPVEAKGVVRVR
jgi:hypothetical protein